MTTDLRSMSVDELKAWGKSRTIMSHLIDDEAFNEMDRRIKEAQQQTSCPTGHDNDSKEFRVSCHEAQQQQIANDKDCQEKNLSLVNENIWLKQQIAERDVIIADCKSQICGLINSGRKLQEQIAERDTALARAVISLSIFSKGDDVEIAQEILNSIHASAKHDAEIIKASKEHCAAIKNTHSSLQAFEHFRVCEVCQAVIGDQEVSYLAWLIERGSPAEYVYDVPDECVGGLWSMDAVKAIKFNSKEEARNYMDCYHITDNETLIANRHSPIDTGAIAIEHMFYTSIHTKKGEQP